VSRSLRYDIPGEDWRLDFEAARERVERHGGGAAAWAGMFVDSLPSPKRLVVDLGFGRGEFLLDLATREPESGFLGVERSFKRVLKMARRLARTEVRNVRLIEASAERVVGQLIPRDAVSQFWINFPDPWPKARHHRRRLVSAEFVAALASRLEPGGTVDVATDHLEYAEFVEETFSAEPRLENAFAPERFETSVAGRMPTAYELEWRAEGRPMRFFRYRRV
jgi:tRNA (guanine-N7-)-methyltransferase